MDFVVGIEILLSNNHTVRLQAGERTDDPTQQRKDGSPKANAVRPLVDICNELQGRYPKDFKFTGWHPHCRCRAISILKTEEEMAKDTERILRGEEPLPSSASKNAVQSMPKGFNDWTEKNAARIEKARKNGTLPYFLRDNEEMKKSGDTSDSHSSKTEQTISDEFRISSFGEKKKTLAESVPLEGKFAEIRTHNDLSTALQDNLRVNPDIAGKVLTKPTMAKSGMVATGGTASIKTPLTDEQKQRRTEIREIARNTIADKPILIPGLNKYGTISRGTIKEWLNQPHRHVIEKNELLLELCDVVPKAEYIDWGYDEHDPTTIAHLIRISICGDDSWIVVREFNNGNVRIHSISDNPNIVEKVTKTKRKP